MEGAVPVFNPVGPRPGKPGASHKKGGGECRGWHGQAPACPWERPARANPDVHRHPCHPELDAPPESRPLPDRNGPADTVDRQCSPLVGRSRPPRRRGSTNPAGTFTGLRICTGNAGRRLAASITSTDMNPPRHRACDLKLSWERGEGEAHPPRLILKDAPRLSAPTNALDCC